MKSKSRVGKSQFRKYGSKDEKLLANVSQLKKTVKLSQQSIASDKGCLNLTSRRLTLAELIGKSRHNSENVRNHALMGIAEFIRRYTDEGRLNLCLILQVTASNLIHESSEIRLRAKNLLMAIISTYLSDVGVLKSLESLYLHLVKGLLSTSTPVRDDTLVIINLIVEKTPWILSGYYDKLLDKVISNAPKAPSFTHTNCVNLLSKTLEEMDPDLQNRLFEHVLSNLSSRDHTLDSTDKMAQSGGKHKKGESNEIECLSNASMIVKLLKLLLNNIKLVTQNDKRIIDILLKTDVYEYENMTPKGKETFNSLYYEFLFTRAELSTRLLNGYTGHSMVLLAPMFILESIKGNIPSRYHGRVAQIVILAASVDPSKLFQTAEIKAEWITQLLTILASSDLETSEIKSWLKSTVVYSRIKSNQFDALGSAPVKANGSRDQVLDLPKMFRRVMTSLLTVISKSPSIWPLFGLAKGLSPLVFPEIFATRESGHWDYLETLPTDTKVTTEWSLDLDSMLLAFLDETNGELLTVLLRLILHISRGPHVMLMDRLYARIADFNEEQHRLVARIAMNVESSEYHIGILVKILDTVIHHDHSVTIEYASILLFHIFNMKQSRMKDGRIQATEKVDTTVQRVDYALEIYNNMLKDDKCNSTLLKALFKMLIDRYLLAICNLQNSCTFTLSDALDLIINGSFLQLYNNLAETHRNTTLEVLTSLIPEYLSQDSIPQWIATGRDS